MLDFRLGPFAPIGKLGELRFAVGNAPFPGLTFVDDGPQAILARLPRGGEGVVFLLAPAEFLASSSNFITDLYRRNIRVEVMRAPEPGSLCWSGDSRP